MTELISSLLTLLDVVMCGIWCIFGSSVDVHQQIPSSFNIAHRGPDCFRLENVNHFCRCVFGFHRLAIVDDIYGMQPMRLHALPHIWMVRVSASTESTTVAFVFSSPCRHTTARSIISSRCVKSVAPNASLFQRIVMFRHERNSDINLKHRAMEKF